MKHRVMICLVKIIKNQQQNSNAIEEKWYFYIPKSHGLPRVASIETEIILQFFSVETFDFKSVKVKHKSINRMI